MADGRMRRSERDVDGAVEGDGELLEVRAAASDVGEDADMQVEVWGGRTTVDTHVVEEELADVGPGGDEDEKVGGGEDATETVDEDRKGAKAMEVSKVDNVRGAHPKHSDGEVAEVGELSDGREREGVVRESLQDEGGEEERGRERVEIERVGMVEVKGRSGVELEFPKGIERSKESVEAASDPCASVLEGDEVMGSRDAVEDVAELGEDNEPVLVCEVETFDDE